MSAVTLNHPLAKLPMYESVCMCDSYWVLCARIYAYTCIHVCVCVECKYLYPPSEARCSFPSQPSPPEAAYLHVSAEGSIGAKEDLALLVGTVVHAWQLVGQAHRVPAPGVCDQQTGADF